MMLSNLPIQNLMIGLSIAGAICLLGYRFGLLAGSGAWAATLIGGLIYGFGGLSWALLLVLFFLSSSLIPFVRDGFGKKVIKRPKRNWRQVLVNGGLGLVIVIASYFCEMSIDLWFVYGGMIAAVTADTWATEIGILSKSEPRNIISWKTAKKGDSGAVSMLGFLATILGSLFIAVAWYLCDPNPNLMDILIIVISGFFGALVDSILGATVQGHYFNEGTGEIFEEEGEDHKLIRGLKWVDNDIVNLACVLSGGLAAIFFGL